MCITHELSSVGLVGLTLLATSASCASADPQKTIAGDAVRPPRDDGAPGASALSASGGATPAGSGDTSAPPVTEDGPPVV